MAPCLNPSLGSRWETDVPGASGGNGNTDGTKLSSHRADAEDPPNSFVALRSHEPSFRSLSSTTSAVKSLPFTRSVGLIPSARPQVMYCFPTRTSNEPDG